MSMKYAGAAASVMVVTALVAGCSSKTAPAPTPSSAEVISTAPLAIPVTIMGGVVTPDNGEYEAKIAEPITINVDSDVADVLHVRSVPGYEFEIKPGTGQNFTFTVTVPGQVVIELGDGAKRVATLTLR